MKELVNLIQQDQARKKNKYLGRKYYYYKPAKGETSIDTVDIYGNIKTIDLSTNTELYTNFFKMLVNQKKDYLLAKEPTVMGFTDTVEITSMLDDLVFNAALDGRAWIQLIVVDGALTYAIINDSEIIPIYDKYNKNIEMVYRYYSVNEKQIKIEQWTKESLTYYLMENNQIVATHGQHNMESLDFNIEHRKENAAKSSDDEVKKYYLKLFQ